jgi:hypothetical protein
MKSEKADEVYRNELMRNNAGCPRSEFLIHRLEIQIMQPKNQSRTDIQVSTTKTGASGDRKCLTVATLNPSLPYLLDHLATFHNEGHLLHVFDLGERVAIDSNNVGELSSLEAADLVR